MFTPNENTVHADVGESISIWVVDDGVAIDVDINGVKHRLKMSDGEWEQALEEVC